MQVLVNIDVDDLERGVRFYTEAVGLHLVRRLFDGSVAEMLADEIRVYLLEKQPGTSPSPHVTGVREYRSPLDARTPGLRRGRTSTPHSGAQ